jgi:metal-sulfur cluster biosynthetic enzyme
MTNSPRPPWLDAARAGANPEEERLWQALEEVHDPEWPISVVDMGLIYGLRQVDGRARVQLTFTAMGCPALEMIVGDIRDRLLRVGGVCAVELEIVWDPPWTANRISESGRERLRQWGIQA